MQINIGGSTYEYHVHGNGPPLVLLHGFTGSSNTWLPFISNWQDHFTIITVDLPGHGKTKMKTPYSIKSCCADLKELLQSLKFEKVHLLGYSMGGRIALSFAMYFPEMIESLILESCTAGLANEADRKERIEKDKRLITLLEMKGIQSFVHKWENIPLFATQKRLPPDIKQQIRNERLKQSAAGLADSLRYMGTGTMPSWWDQLPSLKAPVRLIVGQLDEKFVHLNQQMKAKLPNATLHIVKDSGHAVHIEKPNIFSELVIQFLTIVLTDGKLKGGLL